ncbi:hypothetical protein DFP72DRAFT_137387 [Ephemerocybe angulata]|uniref:GATA-type domain-containing protein n=1 Tax=Ephemerocybe angulata TaxID=980116 RepID=A0A8H6MBC1_9AGAR|nr:hypothetical protein DFP72DRAFT_137387 [Tulosesus angulatus]
MEIGAEIQRRGLNRRLKVLGTKGEFSPHADVGWFGSVSSTLLPAPRTIWLYALTHSPSTQLSRAPARFFDGLTITVSETSSAPAMAQFGWNDDDERKDAPTPTNDTPQKAVPAELIDPALRPDNSNPKRPMSRTHRLPSPPASIMPPPSHSPSPSIQSSGATAQDRATSTSTPPVRRSPPTLHGPPPSLFSSSYHHDGQQQQQPRADLGPPPPAHGGYLYAPPPHGSHSHSQAHSHPPPPPFDPRYDAHHQHHPPPYHTASGLPTHFASVQQQGQMSHHHPHPGSYGHPQAAYPPPGQAPVTIVHTDDAATKLSDRVRRRCFNCCTTDTSTWRRSNLSPGKVLCNKCGLFERTHSRPRPEQFPHKRGPLATTSLQRRTPPAQQGQAQHQGQPQGQPQHLPPHAQQQQHSQHVQYGGQQQHTLPPIGGQYTYSHPSIAPLSGGPGDRHGGLPGLGPWVDNGPPPPQSQQQSHSHGPNSHSGPASHGSHGPSSQSGSGSASANGNGNGNGRRESGGGSPGLTNRLPTPPPSLSRSVNTSGESLREDGRDGRE